MECSFDSLIVRKFPDRPNIKVYPIADLHLGAIECMEETWQKFCKMILNDPNAYLILAGDLITNNVRTSVGSPFEQVYRPATQKKIMVKYLEPMRDRVLCMVGGNHEARTMKDTDQSPAYDIAAKLDLEDVFRDDIAFLKLQFGDSEKTGRLNPAYTFTVVHGAGSSIYTTNAAMRAERFGMAIDGCDCLIAGHIHKPQTFPVGKYVIDKYNNRVSVRPFEVFICTSWMTNSPYATKKLSSPVVFSLNHLELYGKRKALIPVRDVDFM